MRICVIGLGKLGLPLAVQFAIKQNKVVGLDINQTTVDTINLGIAPFPGELDLEYKLKTVVADGNLYATSNSLTAISDADVIIVVVPLVVNEKYMPEFNLIEAATESIGKNMKRGSLVIYETTLPVGTTRGKFLPLLEIHSGFKGGEDFSLAFSPERVLTGRVFTDLQRYPKLVGGIDKESADRALRFYESVIDFAERPDLERKNGVWNLGSTEAAELVKLAETTYRDVNIALANQFASFAKSREINISDVIDAANSQDYSHIHKPGIAVGGHCIPVYPHLYLMNDPDASVVSAARQHNEGMPGRALEEISKILGRLTGMHCLILGISYRAGVKETAFSGSIKLLSILAEMGVEVSAHDPLYSDEELLELGFIPFSASRSIDFAILQNDWDGYKNLTQDSLPGCKVILDGRRILSPDSFPDIKFLSV
jgi:nucleotide sugar dehydrogenase